MTEQVKKILTHYGAENLGVRSKLARILNHGTLGGTGRMVILPVDQGFEHGPARRIYESQGIPIATVVDRVRHVVQSAFNGRRMVIFSGGSKVSEAAFYKDIKGIYEGGGFGSIIGRKRRRSGFSGRLWKSMPGNRIEPIAKMRTKMS